MPSFHSLTAFPHLSPTTETVKATDNTKQRQLNRLLITIHAYVPGFIYFRWLYFCRQMPPAINSRQSPSHDRRYRCGQTTWSVGDVIFWEIDRDSSSHSKRIGPQEVNHLNIIFFSLSIK
jgi:hypothetical protein